MRKRTWVIVLQTEHEAPFATSEMAGAVSRSLGAEGSKSEPLWRLVEVDVRDTDDDYPRPDADGGPPLFPASAAV